MFTDEMLPLRVLDVAGGTGDISFIILQKSKSRGDLLNKSPSHVKKKDEEGRWDYLYKLEKLKRIKLDEKRRMKDMNEYKRDVDECTFSPKLNSSKMIRKYEDGISVNLTTSSASPTETESNDNVLSINH